MNVHVTNEEPWSRDHVILWLVAGGGETLASGQSTPTSSPLSEVSTTMVLISEVILCFSAECDLG